LIEHRIPADGDPFVAAAGKAEEKEECFYCLGSGFHFMGSIDADGEETIETVPCRRCGEES
jgi:hypothetical protein